MDADSPQNENHVQKALIIALASLRQTGATKDELAKRIQDLLASHSEAESSAVLFRTMCEAAPELIWTTDKDGKAIYFNNQFLQYCGESADKTSLEWFTHVHPDDAARVLSLWQNCIRDFCDFEIETRLKRHDGEYLWFLVRSLAIKDAHGITLSWCGSCSDIDNHRRLVNELKLARDQAQAALKIKSEFVANVSHELRTPLNGILGMVEVLLRGDLPAASKEHVSTIREAGSSLLSIINDILDFSKIEAGKMEISNTQFNPLSVVEGVAEILVPPATAKNLLLLATVDRNVPDTVYGDPLRLRQVLLNLCGNAIKFSDAGQIVLKLEVVNNNGQNQLLFSVMDSGIGISKIFQNRLFEPFMQDEGNAFHSSGGTGLGLSISKHLVELMGGTLAVDSEEYVGSTFSFTLPLVTSAESNDWTAKAWEDTYGKIKLLTLEPKHQEQFAICSHLRALGIAAQAVDTPEEAISIIESTRQSPDKIQAIVLDTIRYKRQSEQFLEAYKLSKVFGLLSVLEIGTNESLTQSRSTLVAPRTSHLAIPLRRKQVSACLERLTGWRPKAQKPFSQTMEVDTVKADIIKGRTEASQKDDTSGSSTRPLAQGKSRSGIIRRALVADDNKINQQVALLFLQDLGFIVDITADGIEAVRAFKQKRYDLVFLDCQMPGINGFEACSIIKEIQQRRGLRVPIIALTANALAGSKEECLERGMDDYLSKPLDSKELNKLVARWLGVSDVKISIISNQDLTPKERDQEREVLEQSTTS